jgi:hypothetical protein
MVVVTEIKRLSLHIEPYTHDSWELQCLNRRWDVAQETGLDFVISKIRFVFTCLLFKIVIISTTDKYLN